MKQTWVFVGLLLGLAGFQACVDPPSYPDVPAIEFVSLSDDTITQITDSIYVTFSFTDGDGDLGFENFSADACDLCDSSCYSHPTYSIFILDSRKGVNNGDTIACLTPYDLPFIPTKGSSNAISGEITVKITGVFCFPFRTMDTLSYNIMLRDRAGHFSNPIQTPYFYLNCQ